MRLVARFLWISICFGLSGAVHCVGIELIHIRVNSLLSGSDVDQGFMISWSYPVVLLKVVITIHDGCAVNKYNYLVDILYQRSRD